MKLKLTVTITFLVLLLAACGEKEAETETANNNGNDMGDPVTLSFAATTDDSGIDKDITDYFEEKIEETSDGTIDIDFFLGGELGGEKEALEQLKLGEIDMGYNAIQSDMYFSEYDPLNIPYLFPDFESMREFMDGPIGDKIKEIEENEAGVIPMGMHGYGARWTTSNEPFSNSDELDGLKIRMPEIERWNDVWAEMGAKPTPIAATEIVTALKTGTVEAQENFLTNIAGRQMWEYQDYLIKTEHIEFYEQWLVSKETWDNKLSSKQQDALKEAIDATLDYADDIVEESNKEFVQEALDNGMELVEVDQEEMRKAAQPAIKKIIDNELADGVYEEVQKIIGEE